MKQAKHGLDYRSSCLNLLNCVIVIMGGMLMGKYILNESTNLLLAKEEETDKHENWNSFDKKTIVNSTTIVKTSSFFERHPNVGPASSDEKKLTIHLGGIVRVPPSFSLKALRFQKNTVGRVAPLLHSGFSELKQLLLSVQDSLFTHTNLRIVPGVGIFDFNYFSSRNGYLSRGLCLYQVEPHDNSGIPMGALQGIEVEGPTPFLIVRIWYARFGTCLKHLICLCMLLPLINVQVSSSKGWYS